MKNLFTLLFLCSITTLLTAQSESDLKYQLEGKRVEVLIEMPASSEGIDIHADRPSKLDFDDYSRRIKKYGIALFPGEVVMITKIKKKGKHIEFQLAGGGYGTFSDESSHVSARQIPKSSRQKEIEQILRDDKDKKLANRKELENELKDLKRELQIAQDESRRQAALESEIKKSRIQEQRLQGGSRFNIRYDYKIGSNELTMESIKNALSQYVNFNPGGSTSELQMTGSGGQLTKGATMQEVMAIYGMPKNLKTDSSCGLEKATCDFESDEQVITTIFVENILVKYTVSSK